MTGVEVRLDLVRRLIVRGERSAARPVHNSRLDDLPGRFRAPRVYSIEHAEDDGTWLWLEDLHEIHGRRWPLEQFTTGAHDLGIFNGDDLVSRPPPAEPWLNQWLRYAWAEEHAEAR